MAMNVEVKNLPDKDVRRWVVARYDESNKNLWYYGSWDNKSSAENAVENLTQAILLDNGPEKSIMSGMRLADIDELFFTSPNEWSSYTAFVFEDEDSADHWMADMLDDAGYHSYVPLLTLHSDQRLTSYIREDVCNRKIDQIFAIARDKFVVVLGGAV